ncbi:MAG TPA: hypothetical protein VIQ28_01070, partial [Burkholderiales bacterium]
MVLAIQALARAGQVSQQRRDVIAYRLQRGANAALAFAVFVITLSVIGWLFGIAELRSLIPGWPMMHPVMAVFGIGGAATLRLLTRDTPRARHAAYVVCGIALVAEVVLVGLYVEDASTVNSEATFYPAFIALVMLIAISLYFCNAPWARHSARLFAVAAGALAVIGLLGVTYRLLLEMPALVELSLAGGLSILALAFAVVTGRPDDW